MKKFSLVHRLRSIAALLAVASCVLAATAAAAAQTGRAHLIVLHTSDISGRVHPIDPRADKDLGRGLARISTAVKGIRAEGPALLLDSGDTINGSPTQVLAFAGVVGDGRDPMVKAMNAMRYDAMALGNHEFDYGLDRLEKSRREEVPGGQICESVTLASDCWIRPRLCWKRRLSLASLSADVAR